MTRTNVHIALSLLVAVVCIHAQPQQLPLAKAQSYLTVFPSPTLMNTMQKLPYPLPLKPKINATVATVKPVRVKLLRNMTLSSIKATAPLGKNGFGRVKEKTPAPTPTPEAPKKEEEQEDSKQGSSSSGLAIRERLRLHV